MWIWCSGSVAANFDLFIVKPKTNRCHPVIGGDGKKFRVESNFSLSGPDRYVEPITPFIGCVGVIL
jgi:hypothetical protein